VTLRFTTPPSGRVEQAGIEERDRHGSALERWLADAVREIPFPPTSGRGREIHYPLLYPPGR
jgi:hypothetical protein